MSALAKRAPPAAHFVYIDQPLLRYRVHDGALSGSGRFVAGLDRIAAKLAAVRRDDRQALEGLRARRAEARVDAAWECLQRGERPQARLLLAQARGLAGLSWKVAKLWLRTFL